MIYRVLFAICVLLGIAGDASASGTSTLPHHFGLGLKNTLTGLSWMTGSGVPWDYRYQYMNNGWQSYNSPAGQNASMYAADSITNGIIPVFTYYFLGSTYPPGTSAGALFSSTGMQGATQMAQMYNDYTLMLKKIQGAYNLDASQVYGGGGNTNTFSTDNSVFTLTTAGGVNDSIVVSRVFRGRGKWLWRVTKTGSAGGYSGFADSANPGTTLGSTTDSVGMHLSDGIVTKNSATIGTVATAVAGNPIDFAVDTTVAGAEKLWIRVNNGNWNNSGAADPVAGTGSIPITGMAGYSLAPAVEASVTGVVWTTSFYAPFTLAGYSPWAQNTIAMVTLEPDLFSYMQQQYGDDATIIPVSVASASGYTATSLADLPNTAPGYAQAMVRITRAFAPGVLIGPNQPRWGPSNGYDPSSSTTAVAKTTGDRVGSFQQSLNAGFDLIFYDVSDRDSAYATANAPTNNWWNATAFENFRQYLNEVNLVTGLNGMLWQVPVGNTLYKSNNNSGGHYQDDRAEFFLTAGVGVAQSPLYSAANIHNFVNAGIIGLLFGGGQDGQTHNSTEYYDQQADGITNPAAISGNPVNGSQNTATATVSDDDGGFLRLGGAAYYSSPIALYLRCTLRASE